jgi:hypothetical protein
LKKAFELSVLCDAEVALLVFSPRGKLYEFASPSLQETIDRYRNHKKDTQTNKTHPVVQNIQNFEHETAGMAKKIELLEISKRKLLGEGLGTCTIEELQQIEQQLERSVCSIRARKMHVYQEHIQQLKDKEKVLQAENAVLSEKYGDREINIAQCGDGEKGTVEGEKGTVEDGDAENSENSDVETELFIGMLPDKRIKRTYILEK